MNYYLKRYGPLTASLAVLFASGLAAGYRWGQHTVIAQTAMPQITESSETTPSHWIENAAAALQKDLELTPEQTDRVRTAIAAPAAGMFQENRQARFKIHLRLLEAHDTLSRDAGLTEQQQALLKVRREQLRQHIIEKFKDIIGNTPLPALSGL